MLGELIRGTQIAHPDLLGSKRLMVQAQGPPFTSAAAKTI